MKDHDMTGQDTNDTSPQIAPLLAARDEMLTTVQRAISGAIGTYMVRLAEATEAASMGDLAGAPLDIMAAQIEALEADVTTAFSVDLLSTMRITVSTIRATEASAAAAKEGTNG